MAERFTCFREFVYTAAPEILSLSLYCSSRAIRLLSSLHYWSIVAQSQFYTEEDSKLSFFARARETLPEWIGRFSGTFSERRL